MSSDGALVTKVHTHRAPLKTFSCSLLVTPGVLLLERLVLTGNSSVIRSEYSLILRGGKTLLHIHDEYLLRRYIKSHIYGKPSENRLLQLLLQ